MIRLQGVSKSFGDKVVLSPTDLTIAPGKTTVLLGTSGCGKSTLLRMMIGLLKPDAGTIDIALGDPPTRPKDLRELRQKIGYVIQDGGLFPHMTGRENVTLMARVLKQDPADVARRVEKYDRLVKLPAGALDRYPAELSGGQRQRVAIMRAMVLEPDVFFLDEPMGALDPITRYDLQEDLRNIFRELKKTVVLVTHDMGEAGFLGDTLVLLNGGSILQQGSFDDLVNRPADPFVTKFIQAQRLPSLDGPQGVTA